MKVFRILFLISFSLSFSGCVSVKSYVDPNFSFAKYQDIAVVQEKYNAKIDVEFQRNGERYERADGEVRSHVERTLRATGVIVPDLDNSKISIKVVVNNLADIGKAAAKGFGTGLTLGAAGTTVTDYYEISIEMTDENGSSVKKDYKHALHTTVGNAKAPVENVQHTTIADGFGKVVEDTILNFVKEMQDSSKLTLDTNGLNIYS